MEVLMHPRGKLEEAPTDPMKVVAIGASAGGINILLKLLSGLPPATNCCLLIVLHLGPNAKSVLPDILRRGGLWRAREPRSDHIAEGGMAYIAPPELHLV